MRYLRKVLCWFGWHDFTDRIMAPMWKARWCGDCNKTWLTLDPHATPDDIVESIKAIGERWPPKRKEQ